MSLLILLRHGESTYNKEGKFTGTTDVPLTEWGQKQAEMAGEKLQDYKIHKVFTSERVRAKDTYSILANKMDLSVVPIIDGRLNEQDFGDLEGVSKEELTKTFGAEKVLEWRRAFNAHPPNGERFMAVQMRLAHFYNEAVKPTIQVGSTVLLVAHGNSLRALAIQLLGLKLSEIPTFELPNAEPVLLNWDHNLNTFTLLAAH